MYERGNLASNEPRGLALRSKIAISTYLSSGSGLQALTSFVFPSSYFGQNGLGISNFFSGFSSIEPRDFPYQNVNAYNSSVVMACHNWISGAFKEAKPTVYRMKDDGTKEALPNHRCAKLLRRPNPYYNYSKLMGAVLLSYNLDGNGYVFKEKADNGVGITRALYYIPHYMIEPIKEPGDTAYISYYRYTVDGVQFRIPPNRILHFKYDLDPYNPIKGRKILQPVYSLIYADEEADRFGAALLRNMAIPGVVITPADDKVKVEPADAEALKENFKRKFGGDKRGEPLVTNFAAKVSSLGFTPREMDMKALRRLPEERVAAQFRIAAVVAGLGAGLDKATYSNYEQAERHSYESAVVPMWVEFAEEWTRLLEEFTGGDESYQVEYDYSQVKALRESAEAAVGRATKLFQTNLVDRAQALTIAGLPVDEARDSGVYYSDTRPLPPQITTTAPPAPRSKRGLVSRAKEFLALKGMPQANLDTAYDMSLEGDVTDTAASMQRELEKLFLAMATEAKRSGATADRNNPEAETERILGDVLTGASVGATLAAIWSTMAEEIEDTARITVALRLGLDVKDVWEATTAAQSASELKRYLASYEDSLRVQTRAAILSALKDAESGMSAAQIARKIQGQVEGRSLYPGIFREHFDKAKGVGATDVQAERAGDKAARSYRANLIAEAETRTYQNVAVLESLQTSGKIAKVKVRDGGDCGWKHHNDTERANGTTRLLSEARKYPVVHPRCRRRFYPVED